MEVLQTGSENFLTEDEIKNIQPEVYEKIKNNIDFNQDEINNLRVQIETAVTNFEQQKLELVKSLNDRSNELETAINLKNESEKSKSSLEEKLKRFEGIVKDLNEAKISLSQDLKRAEAEKEQIAKELSVLSGLFDEKSVLNDGLKLQISEFEQQISKIQKSQCESLIMSEEASLAQIQIQFKEKRFEMETEYLWNQIKSLQKLLEDRSIEVHTLRSEHANAILNLQADLYQANSEARIAREEREALDDEIREKDQKIRDLLKSLKETRESESNLDSTYRKEILAQEKLTNIYKESCEDLEKHSKELETALEENKEKLKEATEQYGALEQAKKRSEEEGQRIIDKKNTFLKELNDENDRLNQLVEATKKDDIYELSPSASAASRLMGKGLTLGQLYSEYIDVSDKLLKSDDDNKKLNRYIEQILQEIEDKSPILKRQREDYERALDTINAMHSQLDESIKDLEKQGREADEARRMSNFLGRENERLNTHIKDLSRQVSVLVTQVEAARAGMPPPSASVLDLEIEETRASDVISQHLVTFRNVVELQEQNAKLLTSLRDVSEKMEDQDKSDVQKKTDEICDELDVAKRELDDLKVSRDRLEHNLENITRQRDVYKTIVNSQQSGQNKSLNGTDPTGEIENLYKELETAKKQIEKKNKEYEEYKKEKNKNGQLEKAEFDKMKSAYEKVKNDNVRLLSQAEYNEERFKTLQRNCEAYQRQINAINDKNNTLNGIVGRHESSIQSLRENVLTLTKKLSQAELLSSNLNEEKIMLKENVTRLKTENESLRKAQESQVNVMLNLEAIKNNLEKNDATRIMYFENKITDLTAHCAALKHKVDFNPQLKDAHLKIEQLQTDVANITNELKLNQEKLEAKEKEISELRNTNREEIAPVRVPTQAPKLRRISPATTPTAFNLISLRGQAPPPATSRGQAPSSTTLRELQVQLSEEQAKTKSMQLTMSQLKNHQANLDNILKNAEKQNSELKQAGEAAEKRVSELGETKTQLETRISELEAKLETSIESEKAIKESSDIQLLRITEDLEERENELEEVQKQLEIAKENERTAKADKTAQSKIAVEMQDKYEREVMLHGADLQAVASFKQSLKEHDQLIEQLKIEKLRAEEQAKDLESNCATRETSLKETVKQLKSRTAELEEQNQSLLDQFTKLSENMASIQNKMTASAEEGGDASLSITEDEARTSEQLREVIKYLRREREVAVCKLAIMTTEKQKIEGRKNLLENQVGSLNLMLAKERAKNQADLETSAKYHELTRKSMTVDALSDSNRLMREERNKILSDYEEAKSKVESLQSQIEPLQLNLREMTRKLEDALDEKKCLENDKEMYKKRSKELVDKLNKAKPEVMIKLQQECDELKREVEAKEGEYNRLNNRHTKQERILNNTIMNKNQLQQQLANAREDVTNLTQEIQKISSERDELKKSHAALVEKLHNVETNAQQLNATHLQEMKKLKEEKELLTQQMFESREREELLKKENEALEEKSILEDKLIKAQAEIEKLKKNSNQLRIVARKYRNQAAGVVPSGPPTEAEDDDEKKILKIEPKKEVELINELKEEIRLKDEELSTIKSQLNDTQTRLESELNLKIQELREAQATHAQSKEKYSAQIAEITKSLDEIQCKKRLYETRIMALEKEKTQLQQHVDTQKKKLSMQQKIIENLQSKTMTGPKLSVIEKPSTEPPPTANIKPMSVPTSSQSIPSPRSQTISVPGGSRSIPTASIRPMATATTTADNIVIVNPLEAPHGGDGAVSSTVTLPQATVTPTPIGLSSTTIQAFSSTLTATVSPTPVTHGSIASSAPFVAGTQVTSASCRSDDGIMDTSAPSTSSTADNLISQAIAMVAPQQDITTDRREGRQKRKLERDEESAETSKRRIIMQEAEEVSDREDMEEELIQEEENREEDVGEPSSSSNAGQRKVESEIFLLSSDDENSAPPPSQSDRDGPRLPTQDLADESHREEGEEGDREAEAEGTGEEVPLSSIPPSRPQSEHPSSSRPIHFHQLPPYEESIDDSIVPSTPTLVVPRPCEGTGGPDVVSSPQVPSSGFVFSTSHVGSAEPTHSNDGLASMAEGGIVDVSNIDFSQLDETALRAALTRSAAPATAVGQVSTDGNISSSGGEEAGGSGAVVIQTAEGSVEQNEADCRSEQQSIVQDSEQEESQSGENWRVVSTQNVDEQKDAIVEDDENVQDDEDVEDVQSCSETSDDEVEQRLQIEQDQDEEIERLVSDQHQISSPGRATRSGGRQPITWDESGEEQVARPSSRGSRGVPQARGTGGPTRRGVARARRARPM